MRLSHSTIVLNLALFLTLLTSLVLTSPTGSALTADESYDTVNFNATSNDHTSLLARRTETVVDGDGNHIIIFLEDGVKFETCAPNKADPTMCTLAYVERSTWGGWGGVWLYDNECNWLGENHHVARNWLAGRWGLTSKLPWVVDIKITNQWVPKDTVGVEIWYGSHWFAPFYIPIYQFSKFCYRATLATREHPALTTSLAILLLTLLSLAACIPTTSVQNRHSGFTNHTLDITSILSPRDTAWSPGRSRSVELEPGIKFQISGPKPDDGHMCYVSFAEKNTWGRWAVMWAFDNSCNLRGYNDHVARNWYAISHFPPSPSPPILPSPSPFPLPPPPWLPMITTAIAWETGDDLFKTCTVS
ncbi:hypothetical protein BKA64DRAFT_740153 [Cadophora sp. MPI-SDFR-AT-0126]|nr:hypothetical protein BKA64DRAFT_740153 [Leotiomycetes sp. MPI-SDFR-AT-0126]